MLSDEKLIKICKLYGVTGDGIEIIQKIRNNPPARNVGESGYKSNIPSRFPSKKMHCTIQAESHTIELPAIYQKEFDNQVFEFWDQPFEKLDLHYLSKSNRKVRVQSTADFFVISESFIGWEEWKSQKELTKLCSKMPNRFIFDEKQGIYHSPPAENFAQSFGLDFRICSDSQINYRLTENLKFLHDYFHEQLPFPHVEAKEIANRIFNTQSYCSLATLIHEKNNLDADQIYFLILHQYFYVDLENELLREIERCQIYKDKATRNYSHPTLLILPARAI